MSLFPQVSRAMKVNRPDVAYTVVAFAVLAASISCNHVRKVDHSVEKLAATLKHSDPDMRYWAAESLGHYGADAKAAVPDLAVTLKDDSKMVRMGAAYALAEIGPVAKPAREALAAAAKDPEKEVRDAATYALGRISAKAKAKVPGR
jgi:HEAT repeat protein